MANTNMAETTQLLSSFTHVIYLSNEQRIPSEITAILRKKKLSFALLQIQEFYRLLNRLDLVGTAIIDLESLTPDQQQKLARIIETLEMNGIGVIILNNRKRVPVRSFSMVRSPVKSFSLVNSIEKVNTDELWFRISVNLAYRKNGSEISIKPAVPPTEFQTTYSNRLAEQLRIGETLVNKLTEELRMAGIVQRDFLPSQLPNTERIHWSAAFLPAEWVSGDIYDIVRIDEKHIGFYIADVVGHGMPAALLTIFVKQAIAMRETTGSTYKIFSPAEMIATLNQKMTEQKFSGYQFATCCYCLLNIETLELTFSRAGHPYPVLIRKGQAPKQLQIRGTLLGIFEDAEYTEQTIQLEPGDKLLLHSDGAEPFIPFVGNYDELTGFTFREDSYETKDVPIEEMVNKFNSLVKNKKIRPNEVDDVTVVGLEII